MTVLDEILATKRDEVTMLHRPEVRDLLRKRALDSPPARDFAGALRPATGTLGVVAEIKRRSPSKGELAPDLDPALMAKAYAAGGASCLSVLTDLPWFGGAVDDLLAARAACDLPVLRKDFTIDEVQVYETRAIGADAILLIVAALPDDAHLRDLHELALGLDLAVLVETHDDAELERALAIGARIVGVNARNLGTFAEDLGVGERLASRVPSDTVAIAESAIRSVDDATRMAAAGFDAVLVGEMLVRASDPTMTVRGLASVVRSTPR
ncbi:MAG TPA: indole-3-glycerol phosphate synthase TrpC [Acidimicrobiia bacterium]|jgi:indole-3-glycerol phosphate synthase